MINEKLNKKEVYNCLYEMTYNSDSIIKMYTDDSNIIILNNHDDLHAIGFGLINKCGTIVIFLLRSYKRLYSNC